MIPTDRHNTQSEKQHTSISIVLLSSLLGTTIEWYDFFLYASAAGIVFDKIFFPSSHNTTAKLLSYSTFAIGFIARPIGGVIFGHIGDRIGRKKTLATTMLLMGFATTMIGLVPTTASIGIIAPCILVLLRILQGMALGGEWAGSILLAIEYAPPGKKGFYGSIPQMGLALGLGLGTAILSLLKALLTPEDFMRYGWRIAFLLSLILVVFGLIIRLLVDETPEFTQLSKLSEKIEHNIPLTVILRNPTYRKNTILGMLSRWAEGNSFNTWAVFVISYSTQNLHYSTLTVTVVITIAALLMLITIPLSGKLCEHFTPQKIYLLGISTSTLMIFPTFYAIRTNSTIWFTVGLLIIFGIIHGVFLAAQGTLYAQLFPTPIRYTGLSIVYQLSGIFAGGLTPIILTICVSITSTPWLAASYLVATGIISIIATKIISKQRIEDTT